MAPERPLERLGWKTVTTGKINLPLPVLFRCSSGHDFRIRPAEVDLCLLARQGGHQTGVIGMHMRDEEVSLPGVHVASIQTGDQRCPAIFSIPACIND